MTSSHWEDMLICSKNYVYHYHHHMPQHAKRIRVTWGGGSIVLPQRLPLSPTRGAFNVEVVIFPCYGTRIVTGCDGWVGTQFTRKT